MTHTPTPWTHDAILSAGERVILAGDDEIALVYVSDGFDEPRTYPAMANAAFIVRAVNSYGAMTMALEDALLQIEYLHKKFQPTGSGNASIARIKAALALAAPPVEQAKTEVEG